ncbi:DUF1501 domain-containing protein [Telmatospirillum sp.]|uniref:DUF1501 domain-containing protein n=1 Tax=Telmatospirillum sp. TaxID=2079197 RepID=UPI00284ACBC3|nr:DUF1501 domain-containing protein [Telmatospirillum sp.]MDR3440702.1 DUF1501 domain-containing protein [Telmatospirillum sp.]
MIVSRRALLQTGAAAIAWPGLRSLALAADSAAADTLVVVFLRGGCDGLSLLAPTNDPDYVADRGPDLRVRDDGAKPGRPVRQNCAPTVDFRLHPEAAPLGDIYDQRHLALLHATGLMNGTRSHFVAQDLMDRGLSDSAGLHGGGMDGWLTRLLRIHPSAAPAIATRPSLPASLGFHGASLAIPDLRSGLTLPGGPTVKPTLAALYRAASDPFGRAAAETLTEMDLVDLHLPRGADGKVADYRPENAAVYEETESGRAFRTVAQLLKMEIGLTVACVDIDGWDHHDNLAGRFSGLAGQFSRALAAFWNDAARYHDRLTVVVMTEFGRRLRTNKSNGADHGHGGVMMVLGGKVNGGEIYGRWPGLASADLDNGVDLAVTTDYRGVLAEVLTARFAAGHALGQIFPGFTPGRPMGLARA